EPEPIADVRALLGDTRGPPADGDRDVDDAQAGPGRAQQQLRIVELVLGEGDLGQPRGPDRAIAVGDVADLCATEQVDEAGVEGDPGVAGTRIAAAFGFAHPSRADDEV